MSKKYKSLEVKCAKFGAVWCVLSNFVNMLTQHHVIKIERIPKEKRIVLTPIKNNTVNLTTKSLFYVVSDICYNCSNCPRYRYNENVKQRVQEEPQPNIQVFPYITPREEQKIQEVEKLPKIKCKMLQNKKQNER